MTDENKKPEKTKKSWRNPMTIWLIVISVILLLYASGSIPSFIDGFKAGLSGT